MTSAKPIKSLLLEQKLVAGLGNIYVDEVLWAAKVHPETPAKKLSKAAMKRVHDQTIVILQLGIEKGGSTIRTYRNALGEDGTCRTICRFTERRDSLVHAAQAQLRKSS